jgi:hypothetical protein
MVQEKYEILDISRLKTTGGNVNNSVSKLIKSIVRGSTPRGAALKAHTFICNSNTKTKKDTCVYKVTLKNIATNKVYTYKTRRVYEPRTVMIAGKPIQFNSYNKIESVARKSSHYTVKQK